MLDIGEAGNGNLDTSRIHAGSASARRKLGVPVWKTGWRYRDIELAVSGPQVQNRDSCQRRRGEVVIRQRNCGLRPVGIDLESAFKTIKHVG